MEPTQPLQSVIETPPYLRRAKALGLEEWERNAIIDHLARNPEAGDEISGAGGARKLRWAAPGAGKSGGYRIITFFSGRDIPVFLMTIYAKGEKANISAAERNALKVILGRTVEEFRRKP